MSLAHLEFIMKIEISELHGGVQYPLDFQVYSEDLVDENQELNGQISDEGLHVTGHLSLLNRHEVMADLQITGTMIFECARCLQPTPYQCDYTYRESSEINPSAKDFDVIPCVEECLYINEPFRVLCKPDCKGLCPGCGVNLNFEECRCNDGDHSDDDNGIDPRMEALKKLL
jgi:uncharacterized protein